MQCLPFEASDRSVSRLKRSPINTCQALEIFACLNTFGMVAVKFYSLAPIASVSLSDTFKVMALPCSTLVLFLQTQLATVCFWR